MNKLSVRKWFGRSISFHGSNSHMKLHHVFDKANSWKIDQPKGIHVQTVSVLPSCFHASCVLCARPQLLRQSICSNDTPTTAMSSANTTPVTQSALAGHSNSEGVSATQRQADWCTHTNNWWPLAGVSLQGFLKQLESDCWCWCWPWSWGNTSQNQKPLSANFGSGDGHKAA